ncbi:MAG: sulfotransferase [Trueperaceae bacterium]|nr:MAG: sulfotransferase [Trueperaceae bacterium]
MATLDPYPVTKRRKLLLIAGWGRSGSTLLDTILGQLDGFFSVGELRYLWDRGLQEDSACGCGVPFSECGVWSRILSHAYGNTSTLKLDQLISARDRLKSRHTLLSLFPTVPRHIRQAATAYADTLREVIEAIYTETGCRIIVDSSKFPSHAYALSLLPEVDLYLLHLVRDPRAVAYSWQRKKRKDNGSFEAAYMLQHSTVRSSLMWLGWNGAIELLWSQKRGRYLRVRYEDFARRPKKAIQEIVTFLGEPPGELPFTSERTVELTPTHTISGNPARFRSGEVTLVEDDAWKTALQSLDKWIATAATLPLLTHYGYEVRSWKGTGHRSSHGDPAPGAGTSTPQS